MRLVSSSLKIHFAGKLLERGRRGAFLLLWLLTITLGALFLYGTGQEWQRLIYEHGLMVSTNLFGTTYYSLVGLHAFHVTVGLLMMGIVFLFGLAGRVGAEQSARVEVLSMYWHFVDAVWVVVFTVVYIVGRGGVAMSTHLTAEKLEHGRGSPAGIELPAPTAWPIVLAFGFTLLFAGLLTDISVSVLGAVLTVAGCYG